MPAKRGGQNWSRWEQRAVLVVRARGLRPYTSAVEVGLIERDGEAYGYNVPLTEEWREMRIPLTHLRPLWGTRGAGVKVDDLAEVSLVFGAWLYGRHRAESHGLEVERISIEAIPPFWRVPIVGHDDPIPLFDAQRHRVRVQGQVSHREQLVPGMTPGRLALRIAVDAFGPPPSAVSFRYEAGKELGRRREDMARCEALLIRARALEPTTDRMEIVLLERDGTPWGTTVPLTTEWREQHVPLSEFRYFAHWRSGPAHRGGEGDRLRVEDVAAVNVCFGSWLYPDHFAEPHTIEIERIALVPSPTP
jgi:hypothetical protein